MNDGIADQELLYLGSCQSFCESKYPSSTHYTLVTPRIGSWHSDTAAYNRCWCKSANGGAGSTTGMIAGETYCAGMKCSDRSYFLPLFYFMMEEFAGSIFLVENSRSSINCGFISIMLKSSSLRNLVVSHL